MFDPMMMMMMMQGGHPMMPFNAMGGAGPMGPGMPGKGQPFRGNFKRYQQNKGPQGQNRGGAQPQQP